MAYLGRRGALAPVSTADIPDNSITSAKIVDGAVAVADLGNDAVGTAELANDVVISTSGAITTTGGMTVDGATVFNEASADVDFRIEGNSDANLFYADAGNDRVGIGTATPAKQLEVSAAIPTFRLNSTEGNVGNTDILGDISFKSADAGRGGDPAAYIRAVSDAADGTSTVLTFGTGFDGNNASEKMRIDNSGKVGIGTTSPANLLTLKADGTTAGNKVMKFESATGGGADSFIVKCPDDAKLYIESITNSNGAYLHYDTQGWTSYSDRRWKTDWTPISGSLEKLNKLEVAKFHNLKGESPDNLTETETKDGDNKKWNIGVSAQDCTSAGLGDVVDNPSDGANGIDETKRKGVSYNELTAVCIQAIQELSAKNDALEAENTALKTRMDALEARITALEG